MDHIKVKDMAASYGYKESYWVIDRRSLLE